MKIKSLLFATALFGSLQAGAQAWVSDSVEMGAGYANDIFYNLGTGNEKVQAANDWDLAFQINKFGDRQFNATIRANHIKRKVEVYSLHMAVDDNTFANVSASDTSGKTSRFMQLMNVDTSWGEGAFYQNRDKTDQFDFGWGMYQGFPDHNLLGDSVYLVKVNGTAYKMWVKEYISMDTNLIGYKFRVAKLDNTNDNSVYVKKKDYPNRLFVYYDIATNTFINREPARNDWDLVFTQYAKIDPNGGPMMGGPSPIAFTGVLNNLDATIAEVKTSDLDNQVHTGKTYSLEINTIGDDWKAPIGSPPTGYSIDTVTYFVKSKTAQQYVQIKFTRFDGASGGNTGKIVFAKRNVATLKVKDVKSNISSYAIVPNPAVNDASFVLDAKDAAKGANLLVTDITGKVMMNSVVDLQKGLNAFTINTSGYATGTSVVTLSSGSWKVADKMIVQH